MSMSDPISDMLTRIRNAQLVGQTSGGDARLEAEGRHRHRCSRTKATSRTSPLRENGGKPQLEIGLKYYAGRPVIERIERVSQPGLRIYKRPRRHPARDERSGRGDRVDLARRDDRPQGARPTASAAKCSASSPKEQTAMSRIAKYPVAVPDKVRSDDRRTVEISVKGPLGTLIAARCRPDVEVEEGRREPLEFKVIGNSSQANAHVGHDARAGRQHGAGRDQGLREDAQAGRRRLPRAGAGRQAEPVRSASRIRSCTRCRRASRWRRRRRPRS